MGSKSSSAPPAPNPYYVASAQTGSNVATAIANSYLGNADTYSPLGSRTYQKLDETYQIKDPTTGTTYNIPRFQETTTLSPEQRALYEQQSLLGRELNNTALRQIPKVDALLRDSVNPASLPKQVTTAPQTPTLGSVQNAPPFARDFEAPDAQQFSNNWTPALTPALADLGSPQWGVQLENAQHAFGDTGKVQQDASLGRLMTTVNGTALQDRFAANNVVDKFGQAGEVQRGIGPADYSADRTKVEDALLSRINPQLDRDRAALENRLVNQGFARGSEAFNQAMDEANRQATDARMQAVLAGGQEQSRLAGLALQQGAFANQAQQQAYEQALGRGQFANTATAQNNALSQAQADFYNQAQQQRFGQNLAAGQFAQNAQDRNAQIALSEGQFRNASQQQAFDQAQARAAFNNAAAAQNNQNYVNAGSFYNQAQQQAFNQNLARSTFSNESAVQDLQNRIASNQATNAAVAQQHEQQMREADFYNQLLQQQFANAMTTQQANNAVAQQNYQNQFTTADWQNAQRQAALQEALALRNQPLNEISALMNGGQVTMPQFQPYRAGTIADTPVGQYVYQSANLNQDAWKTQQNANAQALSGLYNLGGTALAGGMKYGWGNLFNFSDRRVKRDVSRLGTLDNGLGVYHFRYLWDDAPRVGVMADEVERVMPEAVLEISGVKVVDYGRVLGL